MKSSYYENSLSFQEQLNRRAKCIFAKCQNKLPLFLGDYNLLQDENNCIASSTAIGYALEEFLVSKLATDSPQQGAGGDFSIERNENATVRQSFDCFAEMGGTKFLVNVKAVRKKGTNNAVAAINRLHQDYCLDEPEREKGFIVFKVKYSIGPSDKATGPSCIQIVETTSYCLEEVDFSKGHRQDHRNWKNGASNRNSGRLAVPDRWRADHKVDEDKISYFNTRDMLNQLVANNK